jgi:hypothetical protein
VRVGMEASGQARWFERLLHELQFELWIGDAPEIRTKRVRKQKTDRQDAQLLLRLLLEDRFPADLGTKLREPDTRQLLWHHHRMVQMRTRLMNQLQAIALNEGVRRKKRLWREAGRKQVESFALAPWASRRRPDLLDMLNRITPLTAELTQAVEQEASKEARCNGNGGEVFANSRRSSCLRSSNRSVRKSFPSSVNRSNAKKARRAPTAKQQVLELWSATSIKGANFAIDDGSPIRQGIRD